MRLIVLSTLLGVVVTKTMDDPYTTKPLNATGIVFEELGELWIYSSTWNIFTEINLKELDTQLRIAETTVEAVNGLCTKANRCKTLHQYITHTLENIKKRTHTIKEINPTHRQKRSIFNGIGNAFHYLFGTMDNTNEEEIYSRLQKLEADEKILKDLEKQQISIVNATLHQIQKPLAQLVKRQAELDTKIKELTKLTDVYAKDHFRQELLTSLLLQIMEIESRQQTLLDVITATQSNQIHPLLISPTVLEEIYHKSNPICQNCLSILYQTSDVQTHTLKDQLVVRISLPILNLPTMKYYQIHRYPIHSPNKPSTYLDIHHTQVAIQPQTQNAILLKENESKQVNPVTRNQNGASYILKLNTPLIQADVTKECVVKMLINPAGELVQCPLKLQIPPRDTIIQMRHKNTWLYSIRDAVKLQITCKQQFNTPKLYGQGILTVKQPCQVQIGDKTLMFQGTPQPYTSIKQPNYFPIINATLSLPTMTQLTNLTPPGEVHLSPQIIIGNNLDQDMNKGIHDLNEVQKQLELITTPTIHHPLTTTSFSLTTLIIIILIAYAIFKLLKWKKRQKTTLTGTNPKNRRTPKAPSPLPTTSSLSDNTTIVDQTMRPKNREPNQFEDKTAKGSTTPTNTNPIEDKTPHNTPTGTPEEFRPNSVKIEIPQVTLKSEPQWASASVTLVN